MSVYDDEPIMPEDFEANPEPTPQDNPEPQDGGGEEITPPENNEPPASDNTDQPEPGDGGDAIVTGTDPAPAPTPEPYKIKVRFNHEDKELAEDEARPLIQKGMNYDKLHERLQTLEKDPSRSFLESRAKSSGMTVEQYIQEIEKQEEAERLRQLVEQNIPEQFAKEMIANQKFREKYDADQKTQQEEQAARMKQETEFQDFLAYFSQTQGRPWSPQTDPLPQEVWEANAAGTPLKFAYVDHQNRMIQNELAQMRQQLQTQQTRSAQTASNAQRAVVGSVTSQGTGSSAPVDPFEKGFDEYFK